jgi:hypothetical protein
MDQQLLNVCKMKQNMTALKRSKEYMARVKQQEWLKERLTEKGFRDCMAKLVTLSPEYFRMGGTFNWADFEQKPEFQGTR